MAARRSVHCGVLEIMQGLAFLDKFISGDTAKIKLSIGNTLFKSLISIDLMLAI